LTIHFGAIALALTFFASLGPVEAQPARRLPVIGTAFSGTPTCEPTSFTEAFSRGLRELGYAPGGNITVERRCFSPDEQLRGVVSELVRQKVDVLLVGSPTSALAARTVTRDIPIVCASCGDPVDNGLVVSLAHPGGNVTGLASLSAELIAKRVELLREALPRVSRVTVLLHPGNPGTRPTEKSLAAASQALGITFERVEVRQVGDFEKGFKSAATAGTQAVLIQDDPLSFVERKEIARLGLKHRLPTVAGLIENAEAGAFVAYGVDRVDLFRRAAGFVDKILRGTKPADLPIEQATRLVLVINLKTAKAIGLTVSPSFLARADRIIE
jgi:putative ABC transport system substrate-binding protein